VATIADALERGGRLKVTLDNYEAHRATMAAGLAKGGDAPN
jgi:hypothetical protein